MRQARKASPTKSADIPTVGIEGLVAGNEQAFRDFMSEIFAAASTMQTLRRITAKPFGLTSTELAVMLAVAKLKPQPSVRRIADHLHISASNVTADVGKLVGRRLLRKLPDPDDARAIRIALTEKGNGLIASMTPALRAVNDRLFSTMSRAEMETITKLLRHVVLEGGRLVDQAAASDSNAEFTTQ
jgi:MarR family transcriptional regulator, organic hydroperoxide resistance regulator